MVCIMTETFIYLFIGALHCISNIAAIRGDEN